MKQKRLVYGVGVNDVPGGAGKLCDGKFQHDPFYTAWHGMLMRCYSEKYQLRYPTYLDCKVIDEWLRFSAFKAWMADQPWGNRSLDKDLIAPGNKVYGPDFCAFIPAWLNNFMNQNTASRGPWPLGVSLIKRSKLVRFSATIESDGKSVTLGRYVTPEEAHKAYLLAKAEEAYKRIERYQAEGDADPRIISALKFRAAQMVA